MKKIAIIGAGIAGLSAGIHARANGYDAEIFEAHDLPGGLCTSWKRGEYLVDGCIHWLCGSSGRGALGRYLTEVGALEGRRFIDREELTRIEVGPEGDRRWFVAYTEPGRLAAHLRELSPGDAEEIDRFEALIRKFVDFPVSTDKPLELWGAGDYLSMIKAMKPFMREYREYGKLTVADYSRRFESAHIREGLYGILAMPDFSFFALLMMLGWHASKNAGYPLGGSLDLARALEKNFLALGGRIRYGSRVSEILTERKKAVGVRLENGSAHRADEIVSAADGWTTIYGLLGGKYTNGKIDRMYRDLPLFNSLFCLSLGVRRDLSALPSLSVRCLKKHVVVEGITLDKIGVKHYCDDPAMAPEGKSLVEIMYPADFDRWKKLSSDKAAYAAEKDAVSSVLLGALEEILPGIGDDVEMKDAATPVTWERYTSNRKGTIEGWFITPGTMELRVPKKLPGLRNFSMAGQWVQPGGGITTCVKSGRDAVYRICVKDGKKFVPASAGK